MNGITSAHFKCILSIWYSQFSSDLFPVEMAGFVSFTFEWTQWEIRSEKREGTGNVVACRF